jgi:hypothetical protein
MGLRPTQCYHHHGDDSSENFYLTARRYNPEGSHLHTSRYYNLKFYSDLTVSTDLGASSEGDIFSTSLEIPCVYKTQRSINEHKNVHLLLHYTKGSSFKVQFNIIRK